VTDVSESDESHGTTEAHATDAEHPTEATHSTAEAHSAGDAHATEEPHSTAASHPTEASHRPEGTPGTETAHAPETTGDDSGHDDGTAEDHESATLLGVELDSLNLASPRFVVLLVAATLLVALAAIFIHQTGMLIVIAGLSGVGVAVSLREVFHAGEELGLFVPLPALAAVLYAGAGALAILQLVAQRAQSDEAQEAHG